MLPIFLQNRWSQACRTGTICHHFRCLGIPVFIFLWQRDFVSDTACYVDIWASACKYHYNEPGSSPPPPQILYMLADSPHQLQELLVMRDAVLNAPFVEDAWRDVFPTS